MRATELYPLFATLDTLKGIGPKTALALRRLGLTRVRDLLFHLPNGHVDRRLSEDLRGAQPDQVITLRALVVAHHPPRRTGAPWRVSMRAGAESFYLVYFRAHAEQMHKLLPVGAVRLISGRLELFDGIWQIPHPDHVLEPTETLPDHEPIYPLTEGVSQRLMRKAVRLALERVPSLPEWQDTGLLRRESWPDFANALRRVHSGPDEAARRRLAFDEVLAAQLALALARTGWRREAGRVNAGDGGLRARVLAVLPFRLTAAQERVIAEISNDMAAPERMLRLVQGDVGAGKTLVALMAMLIAVEAGGQAAMMVPTDVLVRQHMARLGPLCAAAGVSLLCLTGKLGAGERRAALAAMADGRAQIIIGTHALFQREVQFADLRLAVIDEQHRFGVQQRLELAAKGLATDMLVMTATPIPRTLALARYGDMDVSVLDEKPPGRKPIKTVMLSMAQLEPLLLRLRANLAAGARVWWVCPLVAESEVSDLAAAEARAEMLRMVFGPLVGLAHGQMEAAARDAALAAFQRGEIRLLVATTIIEVGVDVPEASIMIIEDAERFGLAQLHQLRGRVGRGSAESHCVLLHQNGLTGSSRERLAILRDTEDGFAIAEADLRLRGQGDPVGQRQSGMPEFRIADVARDADLVEWGHDAARLALHGGRLSAPLQLLMEIMERDTAMRNMAAG